MKTLFILVLASVMVVLFLAAPDKVEAQKKKTTKIVNQKSGKANTPQPTSEISWVKTNFPSVKELSGAQLAINSSGHVFVGLYDGVYRSTDNGATWTQINNGQVGALAINSSGHIFALINFEIYRSTDNGDHWTQQFDFKGPGPLFNVPQCAAINSRGHIFVGTNFGIYRSTDNGVTWTEKSKGFNIDGFDRVVFAIDINSNGDIFAGTFIGVFRSTDNGETWVKNLSFGRSNNAEVLGVSPNGSVFVSIGTNERFTSSAYGLYRSTNSGDKWTRINKDDSDFIVFNSNGHIFLGNTGGVYRSTNNGVNWIKINKGLSFNEYDFAHQHPAISPSGIMFVVTRAGVYRSVG